MRDHTLEGTDLYQRTKKKSTHQIGMQLQRKRDTFTSVCLYGPDKNHKHKQMGINESQEHQVHLL